MDFAQACQVYNLTPNQKAEAKTRCNQRLNQVQRRAIVMGHQNPMLIMHSMSCGCYAHKAPPTYVIPDPEGCTETLQTVYCLGVGPTSIGTLNGASMKAAGERLSSFPGVANCPLVVLCAVADYHWARYKGEYNYHTYFDAITGAIEELFDPDDSWRLVDVRDEVLLYLHRRGEI